MDRQLINYLPEYLKDFREVRAVTNAEQIQAEKLWNAVDSLWNNQYIDTLDEVGCTRWEKMLKLDNKDVYSLEDRRYKIAARLAEQRPFTYRKLISTLERLCGTDGYSIELIPNDYLLNIKISVFKKNMYYDAMTIINRMIPCNLICNISQLYNRHEDLERFPFYILIQFKELELRETYIPENISAECNNLRKYTANELKVANCEMMRTYGMRVRT